MSHIETVLWAGALAAFGVGDLVTTVWGIRSFGLLETNPIVVRLVGRRPSAAATAAFKGTVIGTAGGVYFTVEVVSGSRLPLLIPLLLLGVGVWATASNLLVMWLVWLRSRRGPGERADSP